MANQLCSTWPLSKPMLIYCELNPRNPVQVKFWWKRNNFNISNWTWKCCQKNGGNFVSASICLAHCGLVTSYGDLDLSQYWFRLWLVAWWHKAFTWSNVDLSSLRSNGIYLTAILQETHRLAVITFIWILLIKKNKNKNWNSFSISFFFTCLTQRQHFQDYCYFFSGLSYKTIPECGTGSSVDGASAGPVKFFRNISISVDVWSS